MGDPDKITTEQFNYITESLEKASNHGETRTRKYHATNSLNSFRISRKTRRYLNFLKLFSDTLLRVRISTLCKLAHGTFNKKKDIARKQAVPNSS